MTTLLPVALRGIKTELVRDAVRILCLFFNAIEEKVIDEEKLLHLERRHFKTLCLLEATFPPSFFDLVQHLTAHLAREIWFLYQMFPYERFYGFLKSLVHNLLFLEGAIVRGYEAMGYMNPQNPIRVPRSWNEGRLSGVGSMGKRSVTPDADAFEKAHFTVTQQLYLITQFANEHKRQLREDIPNRGRALLAKIHMQGFSRWLRDYVETCSNNAVITDEIRNIVAGPLFNVTRYEGMDINGYTFYTMTHDTGPLCMYGPSLTTVMTMLMTRRQTHIIVKKRRYGSLIM
jgi:hypothetical protein